METDWLVPTDPADLEAELKRLRRKKAGRLYPWERGPVAWEISTRADEVLDHLANHPRKFFSLRQTAKIFGVSTQPVRDWVRRRDLKRDGPRHQFKKDELRRFLNRLVKKAEPFDTDTYLDRIHGRNNDGPRPFQKLRDSRFIWPKGVKALTPMQLAAIIGCHSSLIHKAIKAGRVRSRPRSAQRNEITRSQWSNAFLFSLVKKI